MSNIVFVYILSVLPKVRILLYILFFLVIPMVVASYNNSVSSKKLIKLFLLLETLCLALWVLIPNKDIAFGYSCRR